MHTGSTTDVWARFLCGRHIVLRMSAPALHACTDGTKLTCKLVILMARTVALWGYNKYVASTLVGAAILMLVGRFRNPRVAAAKQILFQPLSLYVISQVASSAIRGLFIQLSGVPPLTTGSAEYPDAIVRLLGCVPCLPDQDAWPAYACMIAAETGEFVSDTCPTHAIEIIQPRYPRHHAAQEKVRSARYGPFLPCLSVCIHPDLTT